MCCPGIVIIIAVISYSYHTAPALSQKSCQRLTEHLHNKRSHYVNLEALDVKITSWTRDKNVGMQISGSNKLNDYFKL